MNSVIPLGWDDVGDFSSLADLLPAEANQPRVLGDNNLGIEIFVLLYLPNAKVPCSAH